MPTEENNEGVPLAEGVPEKTMSEDGPMPPSRRQIITEDDIKTLNERSRSDFQKNARLRTESVPDPRNQAKSYTAPAPRGPQLRIRRMAAVTRLQRVIRELGEVAAAILQEQARAPIEAAHESGLLDDETAANVLDVVGDAHREVESLREGMVRINKAVQYGAALGGAALARRVREITSEYLDGPGEQPGFHNRKYPYDAETLIKELTNDELDLSRQQRRHLRTKLDDLLDELERRDL